MEDGLHARPTTQPACPVSGLTDSASPCLARASHTLSTRSEQPNATREPGAPGPAPLPLLDTGHATEHTTLLPLYVSVAMPVAMSQRRTEWSQPPENSTPGVANAAHDTVCRWPCSCVRASSCTSAGPDATATASAAPSLPAFLRLDAPLAAPAVVAPASTAAATTSPGPRHTFKLPSHPQLTMCSPPGLTATACTASVWPGKLASSCELPLVPTCHMCTAASLPALTTTRPDVEAVAAAGTQATAFTPPACARQVAEQDASAPETSHTRMQPS
mmetsp:Transcript_25699/g.65288  ORF Transcript_25699/g.65288 Transcript_25699/m.65288 type:complete len:274 (-) Transcript_25699:162-983(-)